MKKRTKMFRINQELTTVQLIVIFYFLATAIATLLLSNPLIHKEGIDLEFLDIVFTAVSAVSVTGLTAIPIAESFNGYGYVTLAFILQFGGIGIMTLGTFIWLILGKKIGLKERQLIQVDQNRSTLSGLVAVMIKILITIIVIEVFGTLILSSYFLSYYPTWQEALVHGFFGAVSATTNGGFDITGQSLIPFANDYFVQTVNMMLIILGAIGFPVLIEVGDFLRGVHERNYHFSLFTKLTTVTFMSLIGIGFILIIAFEWNHFFAGKSWHESLFYALFQSVTSRSGGLATMDINNFSLETQLTLAILMFIGGSPSSVGGGIRTTTFAIALLTIYSYAKGNSSIKIFKREVYPEDMVRSFVVITTGALLCAISVILLSISETFPLMMIIFEVASAFGTTGLSLGITPDLSAFGKLVIIMLMFIGRIGIFCFLFIIRGKSTGDAYHYPKESIIIG